MALAMVAFVVGVLAGISESHPGCRRPTGTGKATTMMQPRDLVRLVRLPLVVTALGDPVVGLFLTGEVRVLPHLAVALAAGFLYLGGMALNDLFDAEVDRRRHPDRVIPAGRVRPRTALQVGATCLVVGVTLASLVRVESGWMAAILALVILSYDAGVKNRMLLGNLFMGACRGLSLLVGAAAGAGFAIPTVVWVAVGVHVAYTASVTAVSRLEDEAVNEPVVRRRIGLRLVPGLGALVAVPVAFGHVFPALLPLAGLLGGWIFTLGQGPSRQNRAALMSLVARGVSGILLLDAAYAWGAGGWMLGTGFVVVYTAVWLLRPR